MSYKQIAVFYGCDCRIELSIREEDVTYQYTISWDKHDSVSCYAFTTETLEEEIKTDLILISRLRGLVCEKCGEVPEIIKRDGEFIFRAKTQASGHLLCYRCE